jgi:hypothetical protein
LITEEYICGAAVDLPVAISQKCKVARKNERKFAGFCATLHAASPGKTVDCALRGMQYSGFCTTLWDPRIECKSKSNMVYALTDTTR